MRATPSSSNSHQRSRPLAALLAGMVAGVVLVPAAAMADDLDDAGLIELPGVVVDDENVPPAETPVTDDAPATTDASCDDRLATITPDAIDGEAAAVSITAQSIEQGLDGWINVAWEVQAGTTLRTVLATQLDGSVTELPADANGDTFDVLALTFCGTFEPIEDEVAEDDATPDDGTEEAPADDSSTSNDAAEAPSSPPASSEAPAASDGDATTAAAPAPSTDAAEEAPADEAAEDDAAEEPVVVAVDPLDTPAEPEAPEEAEEEVEEAEVLGIQLTREDDGGSSSSLAAWVLALAILALVGTTGGLVWSRRS